MFKYGLIAIIALLVVGVSQARQDGVSNVAIMDEINRVRVQTSAEKLEYSTLLYESALKRAKYLCENDVWSHDGWTGSLPVNAFKRYGENLEYGSRSQSAAEIVGYWYHSSEHRINMLRGDYDSQGMAVTYCPDYQGKKNIMIVVSHFGGNK